MLGTRQEESMLSPGEVKDIADSKADGWFAVKVALGGLLIHYTLGSLAAIMFFFGWWWGETNRRSFSGGDSDDWSGIE